MLRFLNMCWVKRVLTNGFWVKIRERGYIHISPGVAQGGHGAGALALVSCPAGTDHLIRSTIFYSNKLFYFI